MTVEAVTHETRIVRRQAGPLFAWQFICDCGMASPSAHNKDVAVIARRAHLLELGREDEA